MSPLILDTPRLQLVSPTTELLAAEIGSTRALSRKLVARVPADWPPTFLEGVAPLFLDQLHHHPDHDVWLGWYWIKRSCEREAATLIALGGFKGPPDEQGRVEVGYSVLSRWRGQGYASEGVQGLVSWAMQQPGVREVVARVERENPASMRVLEKCGLERVGEQGSEVLFSLSGLT